MTKYAVDISCWIYVDAETEDEAFNLATAELGRYLEDYEIVNVEVADD